MLEAGHKASDCNEGSCDGEGKGEDRGCRLKRGCQGVSCSGIGGASWGVDAASSIGIDYVVSRTGGLTGPLNQQPGEEALRAEIRRIAGNAEGVCAG